MSDFDGDGGVTVYPYKSSFRVTSPYGLRADPVNGETCVFHGGVDLSGNDKTVVSVNDGVVLKSRIVTDKSNPTWEWGNYVSILSDDGYVIYYCHLAERYVEAGDRINAGQAIGLEGSTGRSTGSHLHFEVRLNNKAVDPCAYLGIANECATVNIPEKRWSDDAVSWAIENGIVIGNEHGDIMLSKNCTREEVITMLHRFCKMKI